jgi:hypothetical protein
MVLFTPPILTNPVPTPVTPYQYLDSRIDMISSQMDEVMVHFRTMASPATQTYADVATSAAPLITPDTAIIRPVLEPAPDMQGPPPPVVASTSKLIGDLPCFCPAACLSYTPQGLSHQTHNPPPRTNVHHNCQCLQCCQIRHRWHKLPGSIRQVIQYSSNEIAQLLQRPPRQLGKI